MCCFRVATKHLRGTDDEKKGWVCSWCQEISVYLERQNDTLGRSHSMSGKHESVGQAETVPSSWRFYNVPKGHSRGLNERMSPQVHILEHLVRRRCSAMWWRATVHHRRELYEFMASPTFSLWVRMWFPSFLFQPSDLIPSLLTWTLPLEA